MLEVVRAVVAPSLVDGFSPDPNLSLFFGAKHGAARDLHALYRGGDTMFRTSSPGRVLRAAIAALDSYLPVPEGRLPLGAAAVLGPAGVVLVTYASGGRLRAPEGLLARAGWQYLDRSVRMDAATLEVVVEPSAVRIDRDALDELDRRFPRRRYEPVVESGRYPLAGIVTAGASAGPVTPASPARRLVSLVPLVYRPGDAVRAADLEVLRRIGPSTEVVPVPGETDDEVLTALRRLAG